MPGWVWRIDSRINRVVATIAVDNPYDLAVGDGAVWALGGVCASTAARPDGVSSGAALYRLDPVGNGITAKIPLQPLPGALVSDVSPSGVAFGEGSGPR